jgi:hypothetical protein
MTLTEYIEFIGLDAELHLWQKEIVHQACEAIERGEKVSLDHRHRL